MEIAIALLVPIISGYLLAFLFLPARASGMGYLLLRSGLSVGLGFGISSLNLFTWMVLTENFQKAFMVCEIFILVGLIVLVAYSGKNISLNGPDERRREFENFVSRNVYWYLYPICGLLFLLQIGLFLTLSLKNPHGAWDAWAIWNLRAKFLFYNGDQWRESFSPIIAHADYPLLLPLNVLSLWTMHGAETPIAPIAIAFLFTFGTVLLLVSALYVLRGAAMAVSAGFFILATQFFITHGASQSADVPLGFYFLATLVLFQLFLEKQESARTAFLIGITIMLSAWAKNEGFLFLFAFILSLPVVYKYSNLSVHSHSTTISLIAGVILVLLPVIYFKIWLAPRGYFLEGLSSNQISVAILDLKRYEMILKAFAGEMLRPRAIPFIFLPPYMLLWGIDKNRVKSKSFLMPLLVLIFTLASYFLVYLFTPLDLKRQLETSLHRLLLQLWPGLLFVTHLGLANIKTALSPNASLTKYP